MTKTAVGVIVNKRVGNRIIPKRINVRTEHVKHSKCRDDFLNRVKENTKLKQEAKKTGVTVNVKRQPINPRTGHHVSSKNNTPETIQPVPYEGRTARYSWTWIHSHSVFFYSFGVMVLCVV